MNTTHKIAKLEVSNFKNLKAVSITPEGNVITLTGPNGGGKPEVLVLFVRDGSLLDTEGLKALAEAAKTNDFQSWIEDVIQDGEIAK